MNIYVNVIVTGRASEPEDESLPGVYGHTVTLARPVATNALTEMESGAIASAVLDCFHDNQGIECLDDFDIQVALEDGTALNEMDDDTLHAQDLVKSVEHDGRVEDTPRSPKRMRQR